MPAVRAIVSEMYGGYWHSIAGLLKDSSQCSHRLNYGRCTLDVIIGLRGTVCAVLLEVLLC